MVLYVKTSNRYVWGLVIVGTVNFTYICDCYFKELKIVFKFQNRIRDIVILQFKLFTVSYCSLEMTI